MGILDALSFISEVTTSVFGDSEVWIETTATFTGLAVDKCNNFLDGSEGIPAFAYEIQYVDNFGTEITAWHVFPNGESPDPRTLAGKTMTIRYLESDPELFEVV